jgi:hypothetical protein
VPGWRTSQVHDHLKPWHNNATLELLNGDRVSDLTMPKPMYSFSCWYTKEEIWTRLKTLFNKLFYFISFFISGIWQTSDLLFSMIWVWFIKTWPLKGVGLKLLFFIFKLKFQEIWGKRFVDVGDLTDQV